jgi:hypothetical protein
MCQAFFTCFYDEGELVSDHCRVVGHYMRTWFVPDVLINSLEWMLTIMKFGGLENSSSELVGFARLFRGLRAMRVLRLIRLTKMKKVIQTIYDRIDSEYMFAMLDLVKLLAFIAILNHFIACMWFAVGSHTGKPNWISLLSDGNDYRQGTLIAWQYTSSLHWSLTQFTPASMEVRPYNLYERIFSIVIVFFAMIAFSSVVGSITSSITAMRNLKNESTKDFWLLRRYLKQNGVPELTTLRVVKYLEFQVEHRGGHVAADRVPLLNWLSSPLQNLLAYNMKRHHIEHHPFFNMIVGTMEPVMLTLSQSTLEVQSFAAHDMVFTGGDIGERMYFVRVGTGKGALKYTRTVFTKVEKLPDKPRDVEPSSWVAEAVLWTADWRHLGIFKVAHPCTLISLEPARFAEAMHQHSRSWNYAKTYGAKFIQWLDDTDLMTDVANVASSEALGFDIERESAEAQKVSFGNGEISHMAA